MVIILILAQISSYIHRIRESHLFLRWVIYDFYIFYFKYISLLIWQRLGIVLGPEMDADSSAAIYLPPAPLLPSPAPYQNYLGSLHSIPNP